MFREEGGVGTISSSVRRTRSRRAGLRRATPGCFAGAALRAERFELAGRRRFALVLVGRLPERFDRAPDRLGADFRDLAAERPLDFLRRGTLRLAMVRSFRTLTV